MKQPRIQFLIHGGPESIEAVRARGISQRFPRHAVHFSYREGSRWQCVSEWNRQRLLFRPDIVYVVNTAMPGAWVAWLWKRRYGLPFILDTGDVIYELARSAGLAVPWKLPLLRHIEALAQKSATTVVVRGSNHRDYLRQQGLSNVALIRDGYTPSSKVVGPGAVAQLKRSLGLEGCFVAGVMGSLVHSPKLDICYGWDLLQALQWLRDLPVRGLIIGDGPGRPWLEQQAKTWGVADRTVFCGRIPYAEVPRYLSLLDVALSTQTNNLAGQVRTTGKLPEYMAMGRFILASKVGEAARVLPEIMLLDYEGTVDRDYPKRLAERIRMLFADQQLLTARELLPAMAREQFSYEILSHAFEAVIDSALSRKAIKAEEGGK